MLHYVALQLAWLCATVRSAEDRFVKPLLSGGHNQKSS